MGIVRPLSLALSAALFVALAGCATQSGRTEADADADLYSGRQAWVAGNYEAAIPKLTRAAQAGESRAQYALGYMYFNGQGFEKDTDKGINWMRKAARQGDQKAIEALGRLARIRRREGEGEDSEQSAGRSRSQDNPSTQQSQSVEELAEKARQRLNESQGSAGSGSGSARSAALPKDVPDEMVNGSAQGAGGGGGASGNASDQALRSDSGEQDTPSQLQQPARRVTPDSDESGSVRSADGDSSADGTASSGGGASGNDSRSSSGGSSPSSGQQVAAVSEDTETSTRSAGDDIGSDWLAQRSPERYTIELLAVRNRSTVERYKESYLGRAPPPEPVQVVETDRRGRRWLLLVMGDYPDEAAAKNAVAELPQLLRASKPKTRRFANIK